MKKYTACFLIGGTVLSLMACAKKDLQQIHQLWKIK